MENLKYRKSLIIAYNYLLESYEHTFNSALILAMEGELKEINSAFEIGDTYTFQEDHLNDIKDINVINLLALRKKIEDSLNTMANINAITEEELRT